MRRSRSKMTRKDRKEKRSRCIQEDGITREVYGEVVVWVGQQKI